MADDREGDFNEPLVGSDEDVTISSPPAPIPLPPPVSTPSASTPPRATGSGKAGPLDMDVETEVVSESAARTARVNSARLRLEELAQTEHDLTLQAQDQEGRISTLRNQAVIREQLAKETAMRALYANFGMLRRIFEQSSGLACMEHKYYLPFGEGVLPGLQIRGTFWLLLLICVMTESQK